MGGGLDCKGWLHRVAGWATRGSCKGWAVGSQGVAAKGGWLGHKAKLHRVGDGVTSRGCTVSVVRAHLAAAHIRRIANTSTLQLPMY